VSEGAARLLEWMLGVDRGADDEERSVYVWTFRLRSDELAEPTAHAALDDPGIVDSTARVVRRDEEEGE
jgi:hypothetical protein